MTPAAAISSSSPPPSPPGRSVGPALDPPTDVPARKYPRPPRASAPATARRRRRGPGRRRGRRRRHDSSVPRRRGTHLSAANGADAAGALAYVHTEVIPLDRARAARGTTRPTGRRPSTASTASPRRLPGPQPQRKPDARPERVPVPSERMASLPTGFMSIEGVGVQRPAGLRGGAPRAVPSPYAQLQRGNPRHHIYGWKEAQDAREGAGDVALPFALGLRGAGRDAASGRDAGLWYSFPADGECPDGVARPIGPSGTTTRGPCGRRRSPSTTWSTRGTTRRAAASRPATTSAPPAVVRVRRRRERTEARHRVPRGEDNQSRSVAFWRNTCSEERCRERTAWLVGELRRRAEARGAGRGASRSTAETRSRRRRESGTSVRTIRASLCTSDHTLCTRRRGPRRGRRRGGSLPRRGSGYFSKRLYGRAARADP